MPLHFRTTGEHKNIVLRRQLWSVMHDGKGNTGRAFNILLILLIIFSIAILPLEFLPVLTEYHLLLLGMEISVTALFTVEYILRIYAAPNRLRYCFSFLGIVDLLSILPLYLGTIGTRYLRIFRLVRLLKIGGIEAAGSEEDDETMERGVGLTDDEHVERVISHHPLFLFIGCVPALMAVSAALALLFLLPTNPIVLSLSSSLLLFTLLFLWKTWLDFSYDVIYVTSRRLIFQNQHLLGRSINHVNYRAITNVKPSYPSAMSYIFRYGTIVIETPSASVGKIELHMVKQHEQAAHLIMAKCTEEQEEKGAMMMPA